MASRLEVTSSHGQLIGDMEEHLSMLIELWLPSDGANCQLSTWTPGMGHFSSTELSQKRKYSHFDDNSAQETKTGSYNNCFFDEAAPGIDCGLQQQVG